MNPEESDFFHMQTILFSLADGPGEEGECRNDILHLGKPVHGRGKCVFAWKGLESGGGMGRWGEVPCTQSGPGSGVWSVPGAPSKPRPLSVLAATGHWDPHELLRETAAEPVYQGH